MNWRYVPLRRGDQAALWQYGENKDNRGGFGATVYVIDWRRTNWYPDDWNESMGWEVVNQQCDRLGLIPFDTPEEEMKRQAIALYVAARMA